MQVRVHPVLRRACLREDLGREHQRGLGRGETRSRAAPRWRRTPCPRSGSSSWPSACTRTRQPQAASGAVEGHWQNSRFVHDSLFLSWEKHRPAHLGDQTVLADPCQAGSPGSSSRDRRACARTLESGEEATEAQVRLRAERLGLTDATGRSRGRDLGRRHRGDAVAGHDPGAPRHRYDPDHVDAGGRSRAWYRDADTWSAGEVDPLRQDVPVRP